MTGPLLEVSIQNGILGGSGWSKPYAYPENRIESPMIAIEAAYGHQAAHL